MAPSFWRKPGTKTFQLVHRSQRDPLINDPDASDRVLKEVTKGSKREQYQAYESNLKGGEDEDVGVSNEDITESPFTPDASSYGIFYDDQEYDYLQHLRSVGDRPDATLVEAPSKKQQQRIKSKKDGEIVGFQERTNPSSKLVLPEDSLPSHPLDEISYSNYHQIRQKNHGEKSLMPDLDPRVREVLEALDDDAYAVDDGQGTDGEDEFWGGVLKGGEGDGGGDLDWEEEVEETGKSFENLQLANGKQISVPTNGGGEWDAVKRFKAQREREQEQNSDDEEEYESEMGDTIAELVKSNARRPPRGGGGGGGAGSAMGSSFSMSSSAMFRNEGLRTLDDRFDQIEKLYQESDDDSWGGGGGGSDDDDDDDESERGGGGGGEFHGPQREDLEEIMDEFLSRYEVIGGKMRQQLKPLSSEDLNSKEYEGLDPEEAQRRANASKLDRIRASLAQLDLDGDGDGDDDDEIVQRRKEKERILKIVERQEREEERRMRKGGGGLITPKVDILEDRRRDRWDCETVLSTYSNLSNHPRLLRIRDNKLKTPKPAQIKLDPKTGFPLVNGELVTGRDTIMENVEEEEQDEEEMEEYIPKETIKRPRGETPEEKKLRKQQVKEERQSRRSEKKFTKESFEKEVKRQKKIGGRRVADGGAADIRPGLQEGVKRLA